MKITSITETTSAGSVATVAQPFKSVQKREPVMKAGKGSNLLKGIKTSAKYANSLHEGTQVDEVSTELLGRYKKAAGADASAADKKGDFKKGNKRFKGIVKATNKQFDNDAKSSNVNEISDTKAQNYKQQAMNDVPKSLHQAGNRLRGIEKVNDRTHAKEIDQRLAHTGDPRMSGVTEDEIKESDLIRAPGKGRQFKPGLLNKPEVSLNPTDIVKVDVPLLIRLLEYAKEDAPDDMALHDLAEKLVAGCTRGKTLTMRDYADLVPEMTEGFGGAVAGATIGMAAPELGGPVTGAKIGSAVQDAFAESRKRK